MTQSSGSRTSHYIKMHVALFCIAAGAAIATYQGLVTALQFSALAACEILFIVLSCVLVLDLTGLHRRVRVGDGMEKIVIATLRELENLDSHAERVLFSEVVRVMRKDPGLFFDSLKQLPSSTLIRLSKFIADSAVDEKREISPLNSDGHDLINHGEELLELERLEGAVSDVRSQLSKRAPDSGTASRLSTV